MECKIKELIDSAKKESLNDTYIGKERMIELLSIDPFSEEARYLGKAGREIAAYRTNNTGRIGSAFGVDLAPCPMNCTFCALGERWHLFDDSYEYTPEDLIGIIKEKVSEGFCMFTIRTTEHYPVEKLEDIAHAIRSSVDGEYYLNLNVGELSYEDCERLFEAGFDSAYHSCRLGEGIDTPFDPDERIRTMKAISKSRLALSTGLDPIGIEHDNELIVDRLELFRELGASTVCVMKRISVPGTPIGTTPMVDEKRIAQIVAVTRIAGAGAWTNVACSPPNQLALEYGANAFGTTTGANPRYTKQDLGKWSVPHDKARAMLDSSGYRLCDARSSINRNLLRYKG